MKIRQFEFLKHLPLFRRHIYLDNNATTKVSRRVRHKMNDVLKNHYGNPSSLYVIARKSSEILEEARQHVAFALNADTDEIYFTGSATESNNAVLNSVSNYYYPKKKKIISTPIEHPSVINTLEYLKTKGIIVEYCPVDKYGRVLIDELRNIIDEDTFLICCMLANNVTGTVQDIQAVTRIAKENGVLVLSDCTQAFGKIPVNLKEWDIDYASFSAHKLHGPKGIGALYIRRNSFFEPFMHGGHQENGMRAGTESLHNIAGFGEACRDIKNLLEKAKGITRTKQEFIKLLKEIKADCIVNSPEPDCLPNTLCVTFPHINITGLMGMLDNKGIAVSASSACSSVEEKPSYILKAIGLSDKAARETMRFSLSSKTSINDIRYVSRKIKDFIEGRILFINMISPLQLSEISLFNIENFILDVRPQYLRKKLTSLPNAHEASFVSLRKHIKQLPEERNIIVVCQHGNLSYIVAYYLKSKGFTKVSSLSGGLTAWKEKNSDMYNRLAGQNVTALQARE